MTNENKDAAAFCKQAAAYLASDDLNQAQAFYKKALEQDKDNYDALIGYGVASCKIAQAKNSDSEKITLYDDAIKCFEKADAEAPVEKEILIYMQQIYAAIGSGNKLKGINDRIHE